MAGKRQHFIPRFLQEGFASHTIGDQVFTWVYRKGAPPFNPNINKVGVEVCFYTDGNDTQADDLITEAEGPFSNLMQTLMTTPPNTISHPQLPELIAHLEVRTRHLRQSFLQAGDYLVSRLLDFVADERSFVKYMERRLQNDPSIVRKIVSDELAKRVMPLTMLEPMIKRITPALPVIIEQIRPSLPEFVKYMRSVLPGTLRKAAKSGHIKVLKKTIAPEFRIQQYKDFIYTIVEIPDINLILGDSAVLFQAEGSKPYKAITEKDDGKRSREIEVLQKDPWIVR